jgi:acylglycerol lipase
MTFKQRAFSVVMLLVVTACSPLTASPGPGPTTPRFTDTSFVTSDGSELAVRRWLPLEGAPKFVVLAVHGFNDHSKAFDKVPDAPGVGSFLAARGAVVYA